jgi:hypothetical protein
MTYYRFTVLLLVCYCVLVVPVNAQPDISSSGNAFLAACSVKLGRVLGLHAGFRGRDRAVLCNGE